MFVSRSAFATSGVVYKIAADGAKVSDVESLGFVNFFGSRVFDDKEVWVALTIQDGAKPAIEVIVAFPAPVLFLL
jgi:hypothetical protein